MTTASGSAAGMPSGMTTATAAVRGDQAFPPPTEPAKPGYIAWLLIAQLVFFIALLGPAIVGIGLKIQSLVDAGVIAQDGATGAAAVLGGFGALFATIANVVFGRLSDRTTSRWGRRRFWIVTGTVIMTVAFLIMAVAPDLLYATIGWSLAQLGANMTLAPFTATLADQVPRFQRGKITAALGIAQNVGILGGTYVAQALADQLVVMFVAPSILAIVAMVVFAVVLPDKRLPQAPPRATLRDWAETFWVSPVKNPDYALAWWSRFLIIFASEWGDLSQLLTAGLAARGDHPVAVFIGSWAGLALVSGAAVMLGKVLMRYVSLVVVQYVGAGVCAVLALVTLLTASH